MFAWIAAKLGAAAFSAWAKLAIVAGLAAAVLAFLFTLQRSAYRRGAAEERIKAMKGSLDAAEKIARADRAARADPAWADGVRKKYDRD